MATYPTLLSSAQIEREAWRGFLRSLGAELIDKPHNPYDAVLARERGKIAVMMDNTILEDIDLDDPQLMHLLGGEPQTVVVIEVGSTPGCRELALEFACRFAEHWPCAVDGERRLYSARELFDLYQTGRPFLSSGDQR